VLMYLQYTEQNCKGIWGSICYVTEDWAIGIINTVLVILSECSKLGRQVQRPIPLPHPIGIGDDTNTLLTDICRAVFPSAKNVHQALQPDNFQPPCHALVQSTNALSEY
jgi:hypothetical protein